MDRLRAGDEVASVQIVDGFTERLLRLVHGRISASLGRRVDPEDVVQSVFRSFFRRSGEFELERSGDLWRLLAAMAIKKVRKQAGRHEAAKRDFRKDVDLLAAAGTTAEREPTADHVVAVEEILTQLLLQLPSEHRRAFEMRLEGDSITKISHDLQKSQRTVRRILQSIQSDLVDALYEAEP